jgi:prepilin-type N-terminal cleavage/methylation domain-containing protein
MKKAFTLVEIVLVMGIISILSTTSLIAFNNFRQKQTLVASAEELANALLRAHIYAREEKDESAWGVKRINNEEYILLSGSKTTPAQKEIHQTERPTYIATNDFEIWFKRGTGSADAPVAIELTTPAGYSRTVDVNINGIINK